ncbi:MAG: hypothetical protein ACLP8A_12470 [Methylovirgula sp.]
MEPVFIRNTSDGRKIEVINGGVCIDGRPVADTLTEVKTHPNKEAILFALPNAAFMGPALWSSPPKKPPWHAARWKRPSPVSRIA